MKLPLTFTLPFAFMAASCSDLTPETEEAPAPPPPPTKKVAAIPTTPTAPTAPAKPTVAPVPVEPAVPKVSFMDPNTTNELMDDEKKKTVSGPAPRPTAGTEDDSVIDIDPPKPPKFTEAVKE